MTLSEKSVPGTRQSYLDTGGQGPALLCLPGWCSERDLFEPLAQRLGERWRMLMPDLRGHGRSPAEGDFGHADFVEDAIALIEASGAREVIPFTESHAGWVAIELRRRLGARVPRLVLLDWIVFEPPPDFAGALAALQTQEGWAQVRERLFEMWFPDPSEPWVGPMRATAGSYGGEMWRRAGREIARSYAQHGSPLAALAALPNPPPTVPLYCQPPDPEYFEAQQAFAREHPWFSVRRLDARTHFPTLEVPDEVASKLEAVLRA